MKLPPPEASLAGCVFLPRIIAKARGLRAGDLPPEYAARFGSPDGVDGVFLHWFGLGAEQLLEAAAASDATVAEWFEGLPGAPAPRVKEWNHIAVNLGRPGFPLADRIPIGPTSKYRHLANRGIQTIFEMLRADEEA
jgi:Domain of unknown function (DUF5069)